METPNSFIAAAINRSIKAVETRLIAMAETEPRWSRAGFAHADLYSRESAEHLEAALQEDWPDGCS